MFLTFLQFFNAIFPEVKIVWNHPYYFCNTYKKGKDASEHPIELLKADIIVSEEAIDSPVTFLPPGEKD